MLLYFREKRRTLWVLSSFTSVWFILLISSRLDLWVMLFLLFVKRGKITTWCKKKSWLQECLILTSKLTVHPIFFPSTSPSFIQSLRQKHHETKDEFTKTCTSSTPFKPVQKYQLIHKTCTKDWIPQGTHCPVLFGYIYLFHFAFIWGTSGVTVNIFADHDKNFTPGWLEQQLL